MRHKGISRAHGAFEANLVDGGKRKRGLRTKHFARHDRCARNLAHRFDENDPGHYGIIRKMTFKEIVLFGREGILADGACLVKIDVEIFCKIFVNCNCLVRELFGKRKNRSLEGSEGGMEMENRADIFLALVVRELLLLVRLAEKREHQTVHAGGRLDHVRHVLAVEEVEAELLGGDWILAARHPVLLHLLDERRPCGIGHLLGGLLESIVERYKDKNIVIYGEYKPYFKNPIKWLFRRNRNVFKNVNIEPRLVNELFSRTKIALNIHNKQTFNGANQRLFEACGAKAYQICDKNPYIASVFQNGEVGLYENKEEMMNLIDYALQHDMSENAEKAYNIILNGNTFESRVKQMIELLDRK